MPATFFHRGRGRSLAAQDAEGEGRMPLTRAKAAVARHYGCPQAVAAAALKLLHGGEWHHVGKYAAEVAYYDTADPRLGGAIRHIVGCGGAAAFRARRTKLREERKGTWCWAPTPGRIARWADQRARYRARAEAAVGHPISRYPLRPWESLCRLMPGRRLEADVAVRAGWSREQIAIALADGGYEAEFIRELLNELN